MDPENANVVIVEVKVAVIWGYDSGGTARQKGTKVKI
jgi:hypothetical protein